MTSFAETIKALQLKNVLVVLRSAGGEYAAQAMQKLTSGYQLVVLGLPTIRLQVEQNPELFVQSLRENTFLANLHYTPRLLPALLHSEFPLGKIIASCSQSCYLRAEAGESIRESKGKDFSCADIPDRGVAFLDLPLRNTDAFDAFVPTEANLQSIINRNKVCNLLACILDGSTSFTDNEKDAYIHKVLQQDIIEQTSCSDEIKFYRFLCTTASMIGTIVNYTALANAVGISAPTARQWLRFLEGTGVVYLLQPLEGVSGKRMVKAPKLYFRDTGIAAYLLQIHDTVTLLKSVYYKRLFENYVVNTLRESYLGLGLEPDWYFYRDSNAKDISLVLYDGQCVYPIIIDKEGLSLNRLAKSFAIIKEFAAEKRFKYGNGCLISSVGDSKRWTDDLCQIDAALL